MKNIVYLFRKGPPVWKKKFAEEVTNMYIERIKEKDPSYEPPKKSIMQCFIATAAYGTSFAHEIDFLRQWRDEYLLKNTLGSLFVKTYYKISPPIADWISKSEKRKATVRFLLDKFIKSLKEKGK